MYTLLLIIIGVALLFLNAFFVAAEFGMVKLRATRVTLIQEQFPWRGGVLAKIHAELDAYLSACQLGITLASLGLGWIGEPAFVRVLTPIFSLMGISNTLVLEVVSFVTAFSLLSFLHIVVGELMPKSLAIRQSEQISLWTALPLYGFYWLMYPLIWLLNSCSNFLLKKLKLDESANGSDTHTSEEIKLILHTSQRHGELSQQETTILAHTLELSELRAMDVMTAVQDMVSIERLIPKKTLLALLAKHHYSRYPIRDSSKKTIVGLVHIKDLYQILHDEKDDTLIDLQKITRPIPKVSYRLRAPALLKQFQSGMPHLSLVTGRDGRTSGFVTLDSLLHLVIGVIQDEFHKTKDAWVKQKDGSFIVKGNCPIFALERALNIEIDLAPEQENIATVGGLILQKLDRIPLVSDAVVFTHFTAHVEKMDGTRTSSLRIVKHGFTSQE